MKQPIIKFSKSDLFHCLKKGAANKTEIKLENDHFGFRSRCSTTDSIFTPQLIFPRSLIFLHSNPCYVFMHGNTVFDSTIFQGILTGEF